MKQATLQTDWPVDVIMTGGQPLTRNLANCLGKACKTLVCTYGSTEMGFIAYYRVSHLEDFNNYSCGHLVPGSGSELKIVGEDGEILPVNQRGEIYIKTPESFTEYLNDPEKTKAAFTEDGWFKTDDMGRMTENGDIHVEGRRSNMIISGGMNVAPEILETVLKTCPGVANAIIVPVSDPVYYQVMCACIRRGRDSSVTEETLTEFCKTVHNDKPGLFTVLPKFYMFLESFPETSTGKTSRKELERIANKTFG